MTFHFSAPAFPATAIVALLLGLPAPARADACRDEIAALFDGGALDPFAQPPHRYDHVVTGADGSPRYAMTVTFASPLKSMTEMNTGMRSLVIGRDSWMAQGADAPWVKAPNMLPEDMEGLYRRHRDQLAANLRDTECLGPVEVEGQGLTAYRYTTQTDADDQGIYFGGTYTVYLDPDTGLKMRQEVDGALAHYQPDAGTDRTVQTYSYVDTITLSPPEG